MGLMMSILTLIGHIGFHTATDTLYLMPYLFATYLFLEYLEHHTQSKAARILQRADRFGPLWGAVAGPTGGCAVSAVAANLFGMRLISLGTVLAVFLATSDEMIPLMVSNGVAWHVIGQFVLFKVVFAVGVGFLIDFLWRRTKEAPAICTHCELSHCHCSESSVAKSALVHTIQLTIFIFLISFILNILVHWLGEGAIQKLVTDYPNSAILMSALIGLIPSCSLSVVLTQLFIEDMISAGALMAGLLSNGGVGLIILYKMRLSGKMLLKLVFLLFLCGVLGGFLARFIWLG